MASCRSLRTATSGLTWCTGTMLLKMIITLAFCVISLQNLVEFDVFRMNLSSLWMLIHTFRTIKAGWGFQLNADATGKVCRNSVDLLAFSVTSIFKHNNTMSLCVISNSTKNKHMCMVFNDELRKAVCLVASIKHCSDEACVSCGSIAQLLADADFRSFITSQKFKDCKLPVMTVMYDNFKGWEISQRMRWASLQTYATCMRQVKFKYFVLSESS
jgi:hypothetical protein